MKKVVMYVSMLLLFACEKDSDDSGIYKEAGASLESVQIGTQTFVTVNGDITGSFTMKKGVDYVLDGPVNVNNGARLTIEPGVNIYGAFGSVTSYLAVQQGGEIVAKGTALEPITFSTIRKVTSIPQPGDWGGIVINGKAPINKPGGTTEGEGGSGIYGGNISNDNSGTLEYVIVEYGGKLITAGEEMNNISLNGLGSETTVNNIQALYGKDDGIEIFGGTVNVRNAISMGNGDDSFDWTYGWTGKGQNWLVVQGDHDGDRGIEADNNEDDFLAVPVSAPQISNVTILTNDDGDGKNTAVRLRHGTKGEIYNMIVANAPYNGVVVSDSSQNYIGTDLIVGNSYVYDSGVNNADGVNFKSAAAFENGYNNSTTNPNILNGYIGVTATGAMDPTTLDSWFDANIYVGAVPANNDWTTWANQLR